MFHRNSNTIAAITLSVVKENTYVIIYFLDNSNQNSTGITLPPALHTKQC